MKENQENEALPAEEQNSQAEENNTENTASNVEQTEENPVADQEKKTPEKEAVSEVDKLSVENAELKDKILRIYSEFDNFKKRTAKERIESTKTAGMEVIVQMLAVLDDFDRAQKSIADAKDIEPIKEGVALIHNKIKAALESKGLEEMKSLGVTFDTDLHEAITNVPAPSEDMKGKVVDELQKGYYLNGKVIRYAKVVVGQ